MSKQLVDNFVNTSIDAPQSIYQAASGTDVVIDSFTASNLSSVNASYKAYISSDTSNPKAQIPFKVVVWGDNDLGIGIVNQTIPAGSFLMVECSALESIYFTVSGRVITR